MGSVGGPLAEGVHRVLREGGAPPAGMEGAQTSRRPTLANAAPRPIRASTLAPSYCSATSDPATVPEAGLASPWVLAGGFSRTIFVIPNDLLKKIVDIFKKETITNRICRFLFCDGAERRGIEF